MRIERLPDGAVEPRPLTPTQLARHLACAHQLERKRQAGELADPRLQAMRERGALHELAYIERLSQAGMNEAPRENAVELRAARYREEGQWS